MYRHVYGFTTERQLYVWHKKELYKFGEWKPLKQSVVNSTYGYYIDRVFTSMVRLKDMTKQIDLDSLIFGNVA